MRAPRHLENPFVAAADLDVQQGLASDLHGESPDPSPNEVEILTRLDLDDVRVEPVDHGLIERARMDPAHLERHDRPLEHQADLCPVLMPVPFPGRGSVQLD